MAKKALAESDVLGRQRSSAGAGVQRRAPRANAFTPAKQDRFFAHLAESANVRASARAAGVSVQTVWDWRRRDAGFQDRWAQALAQGYADLEMQMIGKALFGIEQDSVVTVDADGRTRRRRTRTDAPGLATQLIEAHRASVIAHEAAAVQAAAQPQRMTDEVLTDMRARILAQLAPPMAADVA